MVGMIWTIQVVHYPLFLRVTKAEFIGYERSHTRRMGALLAIPAVVEVVTAAALVWARPDPIGLTTVLISGTLLAVAWIMTASVQAPIHRRLSVGHDPALIARLISTNWWRTALWSLRGLAAAWILSA